jgi:outer membrane protein assembly factor BamC
MVEVFTNAYQDQTKWEPRPADPELEAEMLRRLMQRFGIQEQRAATLLTQQQTPEQARVLREAGAPVLEMDESFDRAWRRVGLALDRIGFAVEDRDRSKGVYFVRYIDPEVDNASKRDEGLFAKLAFWRSDKQQTAPVLQIRVIEAGEKTRVSVSGPEGDAADPATQTRIVNLLHKELK